MQTKNNKNKNFPEQTPNWLQACLFFLFTLASFSSFQFLSIFIYLILRTESLSYSTFSLNSPSGNNFFLLLLLFMTSKKTVCYPPVIGREIFLLPMIGQFLKPYLYGKYFLQKARDIKAKTTCLMLHTDFKITLLIYRRGWKKKEEKILLNLAQCNNVMIFWQI